MERWGKKMKTLRESRVFVTLAVFAVGGLLIGSPFSANAAAKKTITCYKGTATTKVTAVAPKCAIGWSTTKPVASKSVAGSLAFAGTYKGKMSLLWGDGSVSASNISASGSGNVQGLTEMAGSAAAAPSNQCDFFQGSGSISGGGNSLKLAFDTNAQGCAAGEAAPTTVTVTGDAIIKGGTGKYANATGTLKVKGSFAIIKSSAGSTESPAFTLELSGNIVTK